MHAVKPVNLRYGSSTHQPFIVVSIIDYPDEVQDTDSIFLRTASWDIPRYSVILRQDKVSPPPMTAMPSKVRASCDHCHVRKVKCSSKKPSCSRCLDLNLVCVYSPALKYGRPTNAEHQRRQQKKKQKEDQRGDRDLLEQQTDSPQTTPEVDVSPTLSYVSPQSQPEEGSFHPSSRTFLPYLPSSDSDSSISPFQSGSSATESDISSLDNNFPTSDGIMTGWPAVPLTEHNNFNVNLSSILDNLMMLPSSLFDPATCGESDPTISSKGQSLTVEHKVI
jgi:hypothetical protein